MLRKIIYLTAAVIVWASIVPVHLMSSGTVTPTFSDVKNHWAEKEINELFRKGIITGYNGKFAPDRTISRAEFAVMLTKAFKLNSYEREISDAFSDARSTWFSKYVDAAAPFFTYYEEGLNGGLLFKPSDEAVREDVAAALVAASGMNSIVLNDEDILEKYKDQGNISAGARKTVAIALENHFIGAVNGYLNPKKPITRAEAAKLFSIAMRTQERLLSDHTIASLKDIEPLIGIKSPYQTSSSSYTLSGGTQKGNKLFIDGKLVYVDFNGSFSHKVQLMPGKTTFKISSYNMNGKLDIEIEVEYLIKTGQ